jgi:hypothetical protein
MGDYQSKTSGAWNATSTWQYFDGSTWIDAVATPTNSDGVITIRHLVTVTEDVTIDETVISSAGEISVASGKTLTIGNSEGTDLDVSGRITGVGATLNFSGWKLKLHSGSVVSITNLIIDDDSNHDVEGIGTFTNCTLDIQLGYLYLTNNLSITGGTIQLVGLEGGSTLDLNGNILTLNGVALTNDHYCDIYDTPSTGKIQTTGGSAITQNGYFSALLEVSGTTSASGTGDFSGGIRVLNGAALSVPGASTLIISSDLEIQGTGTLSGANATTSVVALTGSYNGDDLTGNHLTLAGSLPGTTISKVQLQLHGGSYKFVLFSGFANLQNGASFDIDNSSTLRLVDDGTVSGGAIQMNSGVIDTYGNTLTLNGTTLNIGSFASVDDYNEVIGLVQTQGTTTIQQGGEFYVPLNVLEGTTEAWSVVYSEHLPGLGKRAPSVGGLAHVQATRGHAKRRAGTTALSGSGEFTGDIDVSADATLRIRSGETLWLSYYTNISEAVGSTTIGTIATTRDCYTESGNETFGGLGVEIQSVSVNLGSTTVTRTTGTTPSMTGVTFIKRFFDISPSTNAGLNATFVFHYVPGELNGTTVSNLQLYKSTDVGSTWSNQGGTVDGELSEITLTGVNSFSRWTAGQLGGAIPTIRSISPSSAEGGNTLTVIITGTNFVSGGSTVRFSGTGISVNSTTVNSPGQITATITISESASADLRDVSVTTPSGRALLANGFEVKAPPPPTLTQVAPAFAVRGSTLDVVLTGTRFASGSSVSFSGGGITVNTATVNSSSQITANITVGAAALAGNRDVSVSGTTGTATLANSFQVRNPSPTLSGLSPSAGILGQSLAVTLQGTGFASSSPTVSFGDGITVVSVSASDDQTLIAQISIAAGAIPGTRNVTVTNPAPGGGTATLNAGFTIYPQTGLTAVSPGVGARGQVLTVVLTGSNFVARVTSVSFGNDVTVDSIDVLSSTQLQARVSIATSAATGPRDVSVTNAGSGGGTATLTGGFTVTNPLAGIAGVTPSAGGRGISTSVTITGSGFVQGVTSLNFGAGISVSSIVVSSATRMTASVFVARDATLGSRDITVSNPTPGGGSATLTGGFTVQNPVPSVTGTSPGTGVLGQTLTVTVTGVGFLAGVTTVDFGSGITVNSAAVDTGGTHISTIISIAAGAVAGERTVTVTNLGPGGGSGTLPGGFIVNNPLPTLTSINPAVGGKGQTLNVALVGTNFVNGTTSVSFGQGVSVNSVVVNSQTSLTANITIGVDAIAAARSVTVTNPPPGGGSATLSFAFNVQNAAPTLTTVSPSSGSRGQTLNVTLSGTGFYSGVTTVSLGSGININSTAVNNSTQMILGITVAPDAAMGPRDVVVTNPAPGGGTATLAGSFTVSYPVPTLTSMSPNSGIRSQTLSVILTGSGFYSGVTSVSFGTGIAVNSTTVNSLTQVTVGISIAPDAAMGLRDVTVTNPTPGGGTATLAGSFTVANPAPTITSVAPVSAGRGSLLKVTVVGTQFIDGVTSLSFGADISVTNFAVKSSTEIDVNIAINPAATAGTRTVTVTNAAPGGGSASLTNGFTITSASPTSIEGELGIIPDQYALQEAYPNPFNPSTRIRYGVPENSRIKLIVHNMLGNVVAELVSGERSKGMYELQWHADNLPSGVYLIRMNAESLESTKRFIASRKVVLVK